MHDLPFQLSRRAIILAPLALLCPQPALARRRGRRWFQDGVYSRAGALTAVLSVTAAAIVAILFNLTRRSDDPSKPRRPPQRSQRCPSETVKPAGHSPGLSIAQMVLVFVATTAVGLTISLLVSPP
jgi:hypothetical protein